MRIEHLVQAMHELHRTDVTAEARAKSQLRKLTPRELKEVRRITQRLQYLIEEVALEQVAIWSGAEISEMQERAEDRMLKREDQ